MKFPDGYKFDGSTTYKNDFIEKPITGNQSCKPVEKVATKGQHYLDSTYKDDYREKKQHGVCPVHLLPAYPK